MMEAFYAIFVKIFWEYLVAIEAVKALFPLKCNMIAGVLNWTWNLLMDSLRLSLRNFCKVFHHRACMFRTFSPLLRRSWRFRTRNLCVKCLPSLKVCRWREAILKLNRGRTLRGLIKTITIICQNWPWSYNFSTSKPPNLFRRIFLNSAMAIPHLS